jgi:PAS domain S-box-containing protein
MTQITYDNEDLVLQNRLLMKEVRRRVDQLGAINTVAAAISQSLDLDRTLETALRAVVDVLEAEAGGISLIDEEAQEVVLRAQRGWMHDFVSPPMRIPFGRGMSWQVINSNSMVVYNRLDGTEELAVPSFREEHFRSIAMAPMRARGKIIGILSIMSHKLDRFDEDITDVLQAVADTVGVALDNARLYETRVENENRLSAVLQSTADGIISTDQKSRISLINHTAAAMLDVDAEAVIGVRLREAPINPAFRDSLLFALSSRAEENNKSFQVTLENGRVLSALVAPIFVERQFEQHAEQDGWVIVLQDVTHLRQAEIARAQFIQAAAHDMRNPLSVTFSSLNMLKNMLKSRTDTEEIIGIALNSVDRLQALIDDLLHLEHIESGYGFNREEVDLRELLYEVGGEIEPLMQNKSLTYTLEVRSDLPRMQLDRRWVKRALHNYLENATKYVPAGGQVTLRVFVNPPMLHIEVVDNGPGIPAQAQARLFERFYRVHPSDSVHGTGLGLAIVKSVAEAHGGKVYVHSKEGQGSTFGITFPLPEE